MDQSRSRTLPQGTMQYPESYGGTDIRFSNPWVAGAPPNPTSAPYVSMTSTTMPSQTADMSSVSRQYRQNSVSQPFDQMSLDNMAASRSLSSQNIYSTDNSYLPSSTFGTSYADQTATSASPTAGANAYALASYGYDQGPSKNLYNLQSLTTDRRSSHPSLASPSDIMDLPVDFARQRQSSLVDFSRPQISNSLYGTSADALEASRGMMNLSQSIPARYNSIPTSHRNSSSASSSSYYPQSISGGSSISSASSYPYYGSIDGSAADMASINGDYDMARPSLPRVSNLMGSAYPHQQAGMMTTFSSRVQSNTQKKHKCKVCDKRFTRPSSLQTHMYSHTGEKPFVCEVAECGRAFSVVSNLRRHRKVHKGHSDSEVASNAGSV